MRPWRSSDSEAVRGLWVERDPRSIHVIDAEGRPTIEDIEAGMVEQLEASTRTGLALLAIQTKSDSGFIGYCGLIIGRASLEEPEIAYELPRHANQH